MSRENVEVARRWFAALNTSTEGVLAAIDELWDADADYYPVRKFPEARPCHGRGEVSEFMGRYLEAYSQSEWTVHRVVGIGDDRVVAHVNLRAEGRGSGVRLEGDIFHCFWLRHGRFFRVEDHLTEQGALHALGLEGAALEAAGLSE